MSDKTYIEICKNDKKTVQLSVWTTEGIKLIPSAAYYEVKDSKKNKVIISKSPANIDDNKVYTKITTTVTASANEYDLYWELRRTDGDVDNHCTKILVIDTC